MATSKREQVYRAIARIVLKWYYEDREGVVCTNIGTAFDMRLIEYCLDVDKVLGELGAQERLVLELVHRDGCSYADACRSAKLTGRPDAVLVSVETRLGRLLHLYGLADLGWYLGKP